MATNGYQYPNMPQFMPYQPTIPQLPIQSNEVKFVQGEAAAKAFNVSPGSTVFLMDSEEPMFYIKSVAYNGVPNPLRKFRYEEVIEKAPDIPVYVTEEKFTNAIEELKELITTNNKYGNKRGDKYGKSDIRRDAE